MSPAEQMRMELQALAHAGNLRSLPSIEHDGRYVRTGGERLLNLSSNDYLGLASDVDLRREFLNGLSPETFLPTSSSSRLLTGNFAISGELESELASMLGSEAVLTFNSGYHANMGILPAIADHQTLILADKLVHASLIDGIRLSSARCIRYRHGDLSQLERLLAQHSTAYQQVIVATESVFSMDGDRADLEALVRMKRAHNNVLLYVDEAHAFGVYGQRGLGCAEEAGCIGEVDFLVGTFGKAMASAGAFVACSRLVRDYLVNRVRTFIFTTALPPINVAWTLFVLRRLPGMTHRRQHLAHLSTLLRKALKDKGYDCPSASHIVPLIVGPSPLAIAYAEQLQHNGFYALPVRPPTVPQGTSRIRLSLTAELSEAEVRQLISVIPPKADAESKP